jgi:hypothetical protein
MQGCLAASAALQRSRSRLSVPVLSILTNLVLGYCLATSSKHWFRMAQSCTLQMNRRHMSVTAVQRGGVECTTSCRQACLATGTQPVMRLTLHRCNCRAVTAAASAAGWPCRTCLCKGDTPPRCPPPHSSLAPQTRCRGSPPARQTAAELLPSAAPLIACACSCWKTMWPA